MDRKANVSTQGSSELQYFRSNIVSKYDLNTNFLSLLFVYNSKHMNINYVGTDYNEFLNVLKENGNRIGFDKWDNSKYDIKLDEELVETIPSKAVDTSKITTFNGADIWWYKNGAIVDIGDY